MAIQRIRGIQGVEALGGLTVYVRTSHSQVKERIQDVDVVTINKVSMTRELMREDKQLRYIGVLAAGCDVVDIEVARDPHVAATNVPGYGTDTVARYTITLLLEMTSRVGHHTKRAKEGERANNADWCFWDCSLMELPGRMIEVTGSGRAGRKVAEIAQAPGTYVLLHDAHADNDTHAEKVSPEELLRRSDVVSLHCLLTEENNSPINKTALATMKSNATLVNNAREKLINEYSPAQVLQNGIIYAAVLDMVREGPIRNDNPLPECDNCLTTSHTSWASKEARRRIMDIAVENLRCSL